jgi:antitoxin HigA-1
MRIPNAMPSSRIEPADHPGAFVRAQIIEPLKLSVTAAAHILGITRAALSTFLNGRSHLSPDMALRLEKAFGLSMDTLMKMQCAFDIAATRARAEKISVSRYMPKAPNADRRDTPAQEAGTQ